VKQLLGFLCTCSRRKHGKERRETTRGIDMKGREEKKEGKKGKAWDMKNRKGKKEIC
jgi:hypothetical protein